jgi:hypothetical protein
VETFGDNHSRIYLDMIGTMAVSLALLDQATDALAECVLAVARRLRLTKGSNELVVAGGLLRGGDLFVNRLQDAVAR